MAAAVDLRDPYGMLSSTSRCALGDQSMESAQACRTSQKPAENVVCSRPTVASGLNGSVISAQWHQLPEATLPVMVDVLDHVVRKDRAAPDMFGNMQSPVIRMEEQFLTQLASQGSSLSCLDISVGHGNL